MSITLYIHRGHYPWIRGISSMDTVVYLFIRSPLRFLGKYHQLRADQVTRCGPSCRAGTVDSPQPH